MSDQTRIDVTVRSANLADKQRVTTELAEKIRGLPDTSVHVAAHDQIAFAISGSPDLQVVFAPTSSVISLLAQNVANFTTTLPGQMELVLTTEKGGSLIVDKGTSGAALHKLLFSSTSSIEPVDPWPRKAG